MTIITLTTDFGTADGYVGAIKGVILSMAPRATLVDISHSVPPQDIRHGARVLATAAPFFPPGTIHVAVIDPGVGSARRGIALKTLVPLPDSTLPIEQIFVGPDNGLFTPFLRERITCVELTNPETHRPSVSATFHGRDLFAPVAAHLANGLRLMELGPTIEDPLSRPYPLRQRLPDGHLRAEVVHVDHFGNLATNVRLPLEQKGDWGDIRVAIAGHSLTVHRTYNDVTVGTLLALTGSDGYLEIAVREGSAAERLGLGVGATVEVWGL